MSTAQDRWRNLLKTWNVSSLHPDRKFEEIRDHYASPGRFYHTLDHVQAVLDTVDGLAAHAKEADAVRLAAWLHDVIYDSKASDNEERSAEFAERLCEGLSIPLGPRVGGLILLTKTHEPGDDADGKVLLDADLAILGADDATYRNYAEQIRQEYAWVPEADYRKGRRQVLERFVLRPRIYHFLAERESAARSNLSAEIRRLG